MDAFFTWLGSIPAAALYLVLAAAAAVENVFPPFPADTVVAFGSFLAARGRAVFAGMFLAAWLGNVAGAIAMYALGWRVGTLGTFRTLGAARSDSSARRLGALYQRWGLVALAISRFLPGVRALVPPFAGALRIPAWKFVAIIAAASALWYGIITLVAYHLATSWSAVEPLVRSLTRGAGLAGTVVALVALGIWGLIRHGRRRAGEHDPPQGS